METLEVPWLFCCFRIDRVFQSVVRSARTLQYNVTKKESAIKQLHASCVNAVVSVFAVSICFQLISVLLVCIRQPRLNKSTLYDAITSSIIRFTGVPPNTVRESRAIEMIQIQPEKLNVTPS